eukprot:4008544-Amphidinium_carterae.1
MACCNKSEMLCSPHLLCLPAPKSKHVIQSNEVQLASMVRLRTLDPSQRLRSRTACHLSGELSSGNAASQAQSDSTLPYKVKTRVTETRT